MSLRSRLGFSSEPLYLMDGSAFIFRSFYALRTMSRSDGFPTNVLYLVARLVLRLLREEKPTHFGFIMDGKGPTFRHEKFAEYKAQRTATPEPLVQQLAPLRELLVILGVPVVVSEGCEADDCIASLADRFRESRPVVILGADKDLKQCLHDNVVLWDPAAKEEKITTLQSFVEETGMQPSSWPDYQALVGDSSDNIPGIAKVGAKTALGLIQEFPTLEELFDRLPAVPPKVRPKLEGQRDNAFLYRELTRLQCDACPTVGLDTLAVTGMEMASVLTFMGQYELRALAREVESMARVGFPVRGDVPESLMNPATRAPQKATSTQDKAKTKAKKESALPLAGGLLAGSASGPQPVTPIAPVKDKNVEQGSLFAAASAAPTTEFPQAKTPNELGLGEGAAPKKIAILLHDGGLLVAVDAKEWRYTGPIQELAAALAASACGNIVTADVKLLCGTHPEFQLSASQCWFDLSLAAYLLSPEDRGYSFAQIANRWGDVSGSGHSVAEHPGLFALDLAAYFTEQMDGAQLTPVYTELELPLVQVLLDMEKRGIRIDRGAFSAFLEEVQRDLDRLTGEIHTQAGRVFNIRSSQQLSDVLFTVLELPKAGKTKGGASSTSQEALEKLSGKHPIIETILEYRKLEKLRSTYLEPLPKLADSEERIHTTFNQTATATGRLSSSNPNLQNIPVRGPMGGRMRGCFVSAPGKKIVCADYSQIELRVLAHLSQDPTLLDAFRKGEDIHSRTAGLLFDVSLDKVTPDMRRNAKTINFGLVYGMGAQKLGQELKISMKEAKAFIERYFERLSKLKEFYDTIEEEAKEHGYVATMAGRRRLTPEITSQNSLLHSQARRQAINTRIQGSAADIIKIAMLEVEKDDELKRLGAKLLLQIHDELLMEVPDETAEAVGKRLAAIMSGVKAGGESLDVPLLVDWGLGVSWAEAH